MKIKKKVGVVFGGSGGCEPRIKVVVKRKSRGNRGDGGRTGGGSERNASDRIAINYEFNTVTMRLQSIDFCDF